jgi:hypothetical protein
VLQRENDNLRKRAEVLENMLVDVDKQVRNHRKHTPFSMRVRSPPLLSAVNFAAAQGVEPAWGRRTAGVLRWFSAVGRAGVWR